MVFPAALRLAALLTTTPPLAHVVIRVESAAVVASQLEQSDFDVLHGRFTAGTVELVVNGADRDRLQALGYRPELLAVGRPFRAILRDRAAGRDKFVPGYADHAAIVARLTAVAAAFPEIARLVDLSAEHGLATTAEGRPLYALKISDDVAVREDEPAAMLVSAHHAREVVTPVVALYAIDRLTSDYGSDAAVTALVDGSEIWIAPVWNPDGYQAVFDVDNFWRKNRRPLTGGGVGVDLNRNYDFGWDSSCAGSSSESSGTYKGPTPESEAETVTMREWSRRERFARVLDYHSAGRETLWSYRCWTHPWDTALQERAIALSTESGYGGAVRPPDAHGEQYHWQAARFGAEAFLTETHSIFQPTFASAEAEAAQLWPATVWYLQRPIPLSGHVVDACSGRPLEASIGFPDVPFLHAEHHASFLPFGRYHAHPPPGTYDVEFQAPGYATVVRNVEIAADAATVVEIALTPSAGCPCDPTTLVAPPLLLGAADLPPAARFQWTPGATAPEFHLNSVVDKRDLDERRLHLPPRGVATTECATAGLSCVDADAEAAAGILYYHPLAACGPLPADEGPAF